EQRVSFGGYCWGTRLSRVEAAAACSRASGRFGAAAEYHPDKQSADVPAGEVEERVQRFIEIDQAWKILGNEETKREYDLQRHGRFLLRGAGCSGNSSL
uniref:DnaJ heat shock protein family (Hsp40) member C24 n=1 Tax=Chelonoidis abingdonii TaxID=106734 RepID=A0A8C0QM21_CHEAB